MRQIEIDLDVKQNRYALEYVEESQDKEVYELAFKVNGHVLDFFQVRKNMMEMDLEAAKEQARIIMTQDRIIMDVRQNDLEAVKHDGHYLRFVKIQDKTLCLEAIRRSGIALKYAKDQYLDKELCLEAIRQNGNALQYVKDQYLDKELCLEAVKQSCYALEYVKDQYLDKELCLEAIKQDGYTLRLVPDKYQDKELCLKAVQDDANALVFVNIQSFEICLEAMKSCWKSIKYVKKRKYKFKLLEIYPWAIAKIRKPTFEMCLQIIKKDAYNLQYIKNQTEEICIEAIQRNANALQFVKKQSLIMCIEAMKQNKNAFKHIQPKFKMLFDTTIKNNILIPNEIIL